MNSKMKTAVFTDIKQVGLEEYDRPSASGNKVLIKVDAAAICTWEQRVYTGVNKVEFPFIGGHEIAGHIEEMGNEVNKNEWSVGDKVVVGVTLPCRNCFYCKSGNEQSCEHFDHSAHLPGLPYRGMAGSVNIFWFLQTACLSTAAFPRKKRVSLSRYPVWCTV